MPETEKPKRGKLKRFLIDTAICFTVIMIVLVLLGPVWMYDLKESVISFLFCVVILVIILAYIGGDAVATAALDAAVEVTTGVAEGAAKGGCLGLLAVDRLVSGIGIAIGSFATGTVLAFLIMFLFSLSAPGRLAYARKNPERTIASDYIEILPVLEAYQKENGMPPEDMPALVEAIRSSKVDLRYSTLRAKTWTDPWDEPFVYSTKKRFLRGWEIQLHSKGTNQKDDGGEGDDISFGKTLGAWEATKKAVDGLFKLLDMLKKKD